MIFKSMLKGGRKELALQNCILRFLNGPLNNYFKCEVLLSKSICMSFNNNRTKKYYKNVLFLLLYWPLLVVFDPLDHVGLIGP